WTDADRRAAQRAAAWVQRRRRRSQRFWFLSMSLDTLATHLDRQEECLLTISDVSGLWVLALATARRLGLVGQGAGELGLAQGIEHHELQRACRQHAEAEVGPALHLHRHGAEVQCP